MTNLISIVLIAIFIPHFVHLQASEGPDVAKYGHVLMGVDDSQLRVEFVRFGPTKFNEYLVKVSGVDDEIDGKIFVYKKQKENRGYSLKKEDGPVLRKWKGYRRYGASAFEVYLSKSTLKAAVNEKESKNFNPKILLEAYLSDQIRIVTDSKKNSFEARKRRDQKRLNRFMASALNQCGATIKGSIDWNSFEKARKSGINMDRLAYWCDLSSGMVAVCKDDMGKEALRRIKNVKCRYRNFTDVREFHKRWNMTIKGQTIYWETDLSGVNRQTVVKTLLENNL